MHYVLGVDNEVLTDMAAMIVNDVVTGVNLVSIWCVLAFAFNRR